MAPIDPFQLLKALGPLLSADGGIKGTDKATQLASLMKKFSKKFVSRCVYCNVLKATSTEILDTFLEEGWNTINTWLNNAKDNNDPHFLLEILSLCKKLPMSLERLKENNTPKVVKALTKYDNLEIKTISEELVTKWMTIIKGEDPPVEVVKKKRKSSKDGEQREGKKVAKLKEKDSPVKEKKEVKKLSKTTAPPSHKAEKKNVKVNSVQKTDKSLKENSRNNDKEMTKNLGKMRNNKRTSSEKSLKSDDCEDVKIKLEEPLPKKSKLERPKTVKSYQAKFRATGLEQEVPLPKKIAKKTANVDKTAAVAAARNAVVKKLNNLPAERITEKRIKPESLLTINESSNANGGIKLIPAKPAPAHILHESTSFIDALVAVPTVQPKRRKKPVIKPMSPAAQASKPAATTPQSPTMKPPKLQFYNETLELNTEEKEDKEVGPKDEKEAENKSSEEKENKDSPSSPPPPTTGEISQPKVITEGQTEEQPIVETLTNAESGKLDKDEDSKESVTCHDELEVERDPNALHSILAHGKRRLKRKNVRWVSDEDLKQIFYFDLDETERVNVLKNRSFCDLKSLDSKREREAFEAAKRQAGDKMEESTSWWIKPIYIDALPALVLPGCYSQEKEIQHLRQQSILQEIYFSREMIPDSPHEPDLETQVHVEPKIIPLDEHNAVGSLLDYSAKEIPKPKALLPEVLSSLIKIPVNLPLNTLGQLSLDPLIPPPQVNNTSPTSPYDPGEPVSPGLLAMPVPGGQPIFNAQPQQRREPEMMAMSNWSPMEGNMIRANEPQFFPNFQMNPNMMMMEGMPFMPPGGGNGNEFNNEGMRMRMCAPAMGRDMYRPNIPRGGPYPTSRPAGPRSRRTIPCRHFLGNGCRFGPSCSFLHPGVNGPPL